MRAAAPGVSIIHAAVRTCGEGRVQLAATACCSLLLYGLRTVCFLRFTRLLAPCPLPRTGKFQRCEAPYKSGATPALSGTRKVPTRSPGRIQQSSVHPPGRVRHGLPRVPQSCVHRDVVTSPLEVPKQLAPEIGVNRPRQIGRVAGREHRPGPALDDVFLERADIGGQDRKSEAVPRGRGRRSGRCSVYRQRERVGRLEIQLSLGLWNAVHRSSR